MRIATAAVAAMTLLLALAVTGTASAACTHPASDYSTGAPWDVTNPGPQPVNDPVFPDQWGLEQIKAPAAWARGDKGAGAVIAVVDTGADLSHPDLQPNLVAGADVTPPDAQGCPGPQDENGHGTHVSGIAAAATDNGIGVAGTAPDAKIMPVRVLDASGSADDATVIAGIKYAADHGAKVINMSLGGMQVVGELPQLNEELAAAVQYAYDRGVVVVAAAGNETIPLCSYPAAAKNAICVGATDSRGLPSFYSNFPNSPDDNVGVRAPGGVGSIFCEDSEDIWSTIWPEDSSDTSDCRNTAAGDLSGYETLAGTSMASPYVAGLAAILSAKGLSNAQILECIRTTSSNQGSYDPVMGYGIVDADAATSKCSPASTAAYVPPSQPAGGSSTGGGQQTGSSNSSPDYLTVTLKRTSRARLARTRKLRVTVQSGKATRVRLRAVMRKSRRSRQQTLAAKRIAVKTGVQRKVTLKISRREARALRRHRHATVRVLYSGGGHKGVAGVR